MMKEEKNIARRDFLKIAGATGLAVTVSAFPFKNLQSAWAFGDHPQEKPPYQINKKVLQVCARACEIDCAYKVVVGVDPATGLERALTLEGRPEDPISHGKFCIKGMGFVDAMYNPDRLMVSLKRTNPKKGTDSDPGWVVMKTADAVSEIIERLKTFKPKEMLFCSPGDPYTNRLCQSIGATRSDQRTECFGTHYYTNCLTITNPPNKFYSSTYTPSHQITGFDYDNAKYQVWFGFDSFSKCGKAGALNHLARGKKKGAKIVMFNPVRTPMADGYAKEFHAVKPGTDLAVALAMIQTMLVQKKYNGNFLEKYSDAPALVDMGTKMPLKDGDGNFQAWCTQHKAVENINDCHVPALEGAFQGEFNRDKVKVKTVFQLLREGTRTFTPEWAAPLCDVPAKDIKRIALEFAAAAPRSFVPVLKRDAAGPNYANSWRLRHAISILNTLTGAIDHDGGILLHHGVKIPWIDDIAPIVAPYPEQPAEPADFRNEFPITDNIYRKKDFSAPGHYGMVGFGLYKTNRAKAVFFRNPHRGMFAMIQPQMLEAALEKMDLVVDWNLYLDDLGYWCDYVIPAPHQFEEAKLDLRLYYPKNPCLVGGVPVQKSPGDQIGWGGFAAKIGLALAPKYWTTDGSGDPKKAIPTNIGDYAVKMAGAAENQAEFMKKGGFWIDNKPYVDYKQLQEIGYGRPHGRVRMYIDEFIEVGFDALPKWAARWQGPAGDYKFSLLITRAAWYMHADPNFINNPILKQITEKNFMDCVWIHPEAGKALGVAEGDWVILENNPDYMKDLPRPVKAKVHLTKRVVRKDCVLTFHGIGHRAKNLKVAANFGYRDGDLIPQKDPKFLKKHDPMGMGWVEDVHVSIRKA